MSWIARKENIDLDLSSKIAVVVGGTQGIGAGVAVRFAAAGASVYIVGRNAKLGDAVVQQMKAVGSSSSRYEFVQADLSLVAGIREAVQQLQERAGSHRIDYLVQTQGGPPNGKYNITSEGHEARFVVQCLSHFGIAYLLAKSGALNESVVNIYGPSGGTGKAAAAPPPDLDDLELAQAKEEGKYGIMTCGARDGHVLDAVTAQFGTEFPKLRAYHIFPGLVPTSAFSNQGFPFVVVLILNILLPVLSRIIGNTTTSYADIPVYLAANPKSRDRELQYSNEKLQPVLKREWVTAQPELCKELWSRLVNMLN
ncbi:hypothetical protein PLICRDRAFT_175304 [Plicaturopsis crispa FD-325 SS-3]|nr:hypothetical protein PLICRDRAFT_175304 [Plicaturopsis crispa FD-325 SS-3]